MGTIFSFDQVQLIYDSAGLGSSNLVWSRSIGRLQVLQGIGGLP